MNAEIKILYKILVWNYCIVLRVYINIYPITILKLISKANRVI